MFFLCIISRDQNRCTRPLCTGNMQCVKGFYSQVHEHGCTFLYCQVNENICVCLCCEGADVMFFVVINNFGNLIRDCRTPNQFLCPVNTGLRIAMTASLSLRILKNELVIKRPTQAAYIEIDFHKKTPDSPFFSGMNK